ncbi:MAG: DMT family transporter [Nocardioidaceae bacterium]|nr:DMT family transporter [Nocardioidaceae bacterium]
MDLLAVTLALLCAATFAISSSVQHHAAESAPASATGLFSLLGYLVRRPLWLVGQVLATCAFVLHASALHAGPIAVVQPIVVSGIVWAVPVRAAISRRWPSVTELRAVSITAVGLAVFLVASNPSAGQDAGLGWGTILLTACGVLVALAANGLAAMTKNDPRRKAFFLGVVGGVLFGLVAGMIKLTLQELETGGIGGMLSSWPPYALLLFGLGGVLTNQRAYRTAGLSASMPALNIVNGLTSLAFGFTVFSEVPRSSPLFLVIEVGALGCMAAGLWLLIQLEEAQQDQPEPAPAGQASSSS